MKENNMFIILNKVTVNFVRLKYKYLWENVFILINN